MLRTAFALLCAMSAFAVAAPPAFAVDSTPPADTTALPAADGGGWYARDPVTVTLDATDAESGVQAIHYALDGGTEQTAAPGDPLAISGDGVHQLDHYACDLAGNCSSPVTEFVDIDATAPDDTTAPPAPGAGGWYASAPVAVTLTAADGGSGVDSFEYRLDGAPAQTAAAGGQVLVSGEGVHVLSHRVHDVAGNVSGWVDESIRIDTLAPANGTVVDGAWRAGSASIPVVGSDPTSGVARVEWRVDGESPAHTGASGAIATVTGDGTHTLETRVVDVAGNASAWRGDPVRIDTVAPLDGTAVNAGWRPGPVTVDVTGSDPLSGVARVEWQLDGGATQSSASVPAPVTIAAEGQHTLRTRVVDGVGNASPWTDRAVRIDGTAPTNLTPVADPAWRPGSYAVVLAAADGGAGVDHMEYRVDGGAATSVPPGTTVTVSGTGGHLLETRAVDLAGNASAWRGDAVNIDGVAPSDTTPALASTPQPNPYRVTIAGTDAHSGVDHVEWELDGGGVQTGPSGTEVVISGAGTHTLRERVVDRVGRDSGWRSGTVTIDPSLNGDTTAPSDDTATVPSGWQTHAVNVSVLGSDAGSGLDHVEWRLDGRPIASGPSGSVVAITGDGIHHLETRAVDYAGNCSAWREQTVRIDTTVPTDTTDVPSGWTASRDVAVSGSDAASGVASVQWRLDGGSTQSGPSGSVVTAPADGEHILEHRVLDAAGQASDWATSTLRVDTVAPVDTTPALPAGWQAAPVTRALSGSDDRSGVARMEWRLDGGDVHTGDLTVAADGTHTAETRAVDAAGNVSPWRSSTVQVDTSAPRNTTPRAPAGWRRTAYRVDVTASDGAGSGVDRVEWRVDGGPVSSSPGALVDGQGRHTLYTRAVDALGHASSWRAETVAIDGAAPALTLDCGDAGWRATAAICAVAADGGPSGLAALTVARGGEAARSVASGGRVTVAGDGTWTVTATAVDGAGNRAAAARTVRVDRTPPSARVSCAPAGSAYRCTAAGTDAASGLARLLWRVGGGAWRPVTGAFEVASGRVQVQAVNRAGLSATSAPLALAGRAAARTRTRTVPVSLRGTRGADGLIGSLELRVQRDEAGATLAVVDLRPLAVGRGRFRTTVSLSSGDLNARRRTTTRIRRGGHTPRLTLALSKVSRPATARLTVQRRSRHRWVMVARATAKARPPKRR